MKLVNYVQGTSDALGKNKSGFFCLPCVNQSL